MWRIQKTTDQPAGVTRPHGVVCDLTGFEDSPDAEVLVRGYNTAKEFGEVAVGRHGNFLQWGYSAPPSKMTEAGRALFLNCICYIVQFDGKRPLVRRESMDRSDALKKVKGAVRYPGERFYSGLFPRELLERYRGDPEGMHSYYLENCEFVYLEEKTFRIDLELKALGLQTNRKPETLVKLVGLLREDSKRRVVGTLLKRYTTESFKAPHEWETWLTSNRDRIYFSDVGGYKFRVVPEGYLSENLRRPKLGHSTGNE